jgi:hypothetical protein
MKKIIPFILMFFTLNSFSQGKKEIKVTKKQVADSKAINDLISDIPKDCKVLSFIFSSDLNVGYREYSCSGESIPAEIKKILAKQEKGKFFFIEKVKADCIKTFPKDYKIILE